MLRLLLLLPLMCLAAATVATAFNSIAGSRSAGHVAIVMMIIFAALIVVAGVIGLLSRHGGALAGGTGLAAILTVAALVVIWRSDRFSFETAGADLDHALADARARLVAAAGGVPGAASQLRGSLATAAVGAADRTRQAAPAAGDQEDAVEDATKDVEASDKPTVADDGGADR